MNSTQIIRHSQETTARRLCGTRSEYHPKFPVPFLHTKINPGLPNQSRPRNQKIHIKSFAPVFLTHQHDQKPTNNSLSMFGKNQKNVL
ncbi:hypothetical protein [Methyloglobulus morosus]|uniref:hypothetical protein n=1 Tax=Methyloglobulus morosus TaxID=1410681 RepID=UPI001F21E8D8|nr:hypothetical protein [Methyloglobulus morosus]